MVENIGFYNLKIIDYPNGSVQLRYYKNGIGSKSKKKEIDELTDNVLIPNDIIIDKDNMRSFSSSVNRSKNTIMQFARSNKWDLFVTLTFSSDFDRTDYDNLLKMLSKWLNNIKYKKCPDLGYIIVPEEHKRVEINGKHAYHFHGLLCNTDGLTLSRALSPFNGNELYTSNGLEIYNINDYHFGFSTATYVQDTYKCTTYISKYVTKALCIRQKYKRRFLTSHNLKKPTEFNLCISELEDIYKYYAISYEKVIDIKCGSYNDTITYLEVDKLDDIPTTDIVEGLTSFQLDSQNS